MPSSVILRFTYEPDRRELCVEFVTGRRYVYEAVPPDLAERFQNAFAKGVFFNRRIRDHYAFREVTEETTTDC